MLGLITIGRFVDTRIIPQGLKPRIEAAGIEFVDIGDAANAVMHFASDKSINGELAATLLSDGTKTDLNFL